MDSKSPLVLLTGATGYIGAHILDSLLNSHHRVIVPIRPSSLHKTQFFLKKYNHLPTGTLTFVEVADHTSTTSFVPHLKGVSAIIHTASVLTLTEPVKDIEEQYLKPVIGMATALFEAALEIGTVKRFVYTSSITAVYDSVDLNRKEYTEDDWSPITIEEAAKSGDPIKFYSASKKYTELRLQELVIKEWKPGFDVVILCPPTVVGKSLFEVHGLSNLGGGSGSVITSMIDKKEVPENIYPQIVNVTECAHAHVAAIAAPLPASPGPHRYLISTGNFSYHSLIPALLKRYPQLVGRLPDADPGKFDETFPIFSTEKVKRELGVVLSKGWEESLVEELWGEAVEYL